MSLLFFDGFQDCNVMPKPEWGSGYPTGTVSGRDGTPNSAGIMSNTNNLIALSTPATTCIVGFARLTTNRFDSGFVSFIRSGVTELVVTVNASGFLELRRTSITGTLLATSSGHTPITINNLWHSFQAKAVLRSDGAGSCEVRLNGVAVINFTGQTAGTTGDVTHIGFHGPAGGSGNLVVDDFWICDGVDATATQGAPNNNFLGDLKVTTLFPTSEGDTLQFTPSTGTAHYSLVDENPVNTTDYVSSLTVGQRDLYNVGDLVATATAPVAVRVGLYAQKSDAGTASIKTLIKENGTLTAGAVQPLLTSWSGFYGSIRTKKPSNDTPWTVADVNGLQVGVEVA